MKLLTYFCGANYILLAKFKSGELAQVKEQIDYASMNAFFLPY